MISLKHLDLKTLVHHCNACSIDGNVHSVNQKSINISALLNLLNETSSDFVVLNSEYEGLSSSELAVLEGTLTSDVTVIRFRPLSSRVNDECCDHTPPFVESYCTGFSLLDRFLFNLSSEQGFSLSLFGKVFNRDFIITQLKNLPESQHVHENVLVASLLLLADKVVLINSSRTANNDTVIGKPFILSNSADNFPVLNCVLQALQPFTGYFESALSHWFATAYIDTLLLFRQTLGEEDFVSAAQSLNDSISLFSEIYSCLFLSGIPQLPLQARIALNDLKRSPSDNEFALLRSYLQSLRSQPVALGNKTIKSPSVAKGAEKPLVSIITVVRNLYGADRIGLFEAMLNSVVAQDYPASRLEHLVFDGASTDGTLDYSIALWEEGRITRLVSEPDASVYNAMNKAMSYINGDCFLFLNSDDYLAPDAISRLVRALEDDSADYAFADAWQIDDKNNKVGVVRGEIDSAWFKVPFCHQTLLCRTFPLSSHRFDESYKITMMKYALDLRAGPYKWAYVPEKLAYYRVGDGVSSAPASRSRYLEETYRVKDYSADMLGLPRELYKDLDEAWRRVTSERHYQRLVALLEEVRADMPANELTETFCESVKRFGRYRLEQHLEKHPVDQPAPVRLALLNSHAYGGAGGAVLRLHFALREEQGIQSTLITRDMVEDRVIPDSRLIEEPETGWNARQNRVRTAPGATQFTVDESCIPSDVLDEIIASYDVFSLQWTARMLSVRDIGRIVGSGKPVFITVRDMEPITGGCHYFHGCMKWRYEQCRGCPQVTVGDKRLASDAFAEKLQVLTQPNVTFVALSDISEAVLRQSPLAYANPIVKIGNGFDPDTFRILGRRQARQALGLDEDFAGRYLIGMMPSFSSSVKGFDVALSALQQAEQQSAGFSERAGLLVAGYPGDTDGLGIALPVEAIGALGDAGALNLFYSACDLLVVPSREETFSNTVAEALLCGTPVFGAMAGAIPEMITDEVNGRLFSHDWDSARIADTLLSCSEKEFSPEVCRASITDFFSQRDQVERYTALFTGALAD